MATQSLFTSQTPDSGNNSDGTPGITFGMTVRFAVDGTVKGVRFYSTTTVGGTYVGALWRVTDSDDTPAGTQLATKTLGGTPAGGAWVDVLFDSPIAVVAGVLYRVAVFSAAGRYVYSPNIHSSDIVNGDVTADANGDDPVLLGTLRQAVFAIAATLTYPSTGASSNGTYFADVLFDATGAEEHITTGTAAAAATAAATSTTHRPSAGTATAAGTASASATTRRSSSGTATAAATATAGTATRRTTVGTAAGIATARGTALTRRLTAGTAAATATGGEYEAASTAGPRLTTRSRPARIVTRSRAA